MARVAILGMGLLGAGFADGLLARGGTELTVWNRTRAKAEPYGAKGARVADTAADAVRGAERAHLVLLDDATVDETIEALRPGLAKDTILVDHTTTLPQATAERAARLEREGVQYLHAPVFMGPPAARDAKGIMMVAGPEARVARVRDALARMTGELWYVGERPDLAACYKLFGNAMFLALGGALADVLHMGDALGVPRADTIGVFEKFQLGAYVQQRGPRILREDWTPSFQLETARKDVRLMLEAGGDEPMPILEALAARMDELIARGMGALDAGVMAKRE